VSEARGVSALERLEALVANPELYALADEVQDPDPTVGGRPRLYPAFMWVLYDALISVWGSGRRVEAELSHPLVWTHLRHLVRTRFPDRPDRWLAAEPMRRCHYLYGRGRYLTDPEILDRLATVHREHACDQARQLDLLDPNGPGSWTHPDLTRLLYADGKVITPFSRTSRATLSSTRTLVNSVWSELRSTLGCTSREPVRRRGAPSG